MIKTLARLFLTTAAIAIGASFTFSQPTPAPTPVIIKIDPTSFDRYVGRYEDPVTIPDTVFSFFREGDRFFMRVTNSDNIEIVPGSSTKFFLTPMPRGSVEFRVDVNGRVVGALFDQGTPYELKRMGDTPQADMRIPYKRTEAMIPMRDGVKLFTVILTPENVSEKLPIYMERTPYGVQAWTSGRLNQNRNELAHEHYVFVFQDIRGRYKSDGTFVMMRPQRDRRDPRSVDESTDTYDTIDWLIKNVANNNGRVGIAGVSYPGWLAAQALIDHHPALKASSPQAPVIDVWLGDDLFHNGAFRETYAYDWAYTLEA